MAEVTYYKIDGNGKRVQVTEEFEIDSSSVGIQTYISDRTHAPDGDHSKPSYPGIAEQLDLLWHDINEGKFGKTAKTSSFFITIKNVKESSPKPSPGH
tara:strand:- start:50 stop:343 length:294 start_codon:yes stop_codon:yes gene_type:complete